MNFKQLRDCAAAHHAAFRGNPVPLARRFDGLPEKLNIDELTEVARNGVVYILMEKFSHFPVIGKLLEKYIHKLEVLIGLSYCSHGTVGEAFKISMEGVFRNFIQYIIYHLAFTEHHRALEESLGDISQSVEPGDITQALTDFLQLGHQCFTPEYSYEITWMGVGGSGLVTLDLEIRISDQMPQTYSISIDSKGMIYYQNQPLENLYQELKKVDREWTIHIIKTILQKLPHTSRGKGAKETLTTFLESKYGEHVFDENGN